MYYAKNSHIKYEYHENIQLFQEPKKNVLLLQITMNF